MDLDHKETGADQNAIAKRSMKRRIGWEAPKRKKRQTTAGPERVAVRQPQPWSECSRGAGCGLSSDDGGTAAGSASAAAVPGAGTAGGAGRGPRAAGEASSLASWVVWALRGGSDTGRGSTESQVGGLNVSLDSALSTH